MTIGERVRECRIKKGMTQTELAEKLGYKSKSSITHIESGRDIPRGMVAELAAVLDTTPSHLMGWDDDKGITFQHAQQPINELKPNEHRMLKVFRKLSPVEQGEIIGRAELLVEQHEKSFAEDA